MVYIGTSGYSFPDWKYNFYPKGLKQTDYLSYYSHFFNCVEINVTYYRIPEPEFLYNLSLKVGNNFRFTVKVPGLFTHNKELIQSEFDRFIQGIRLLNQTNKFSGLLIQFPYSFKNNPDNLFYLNNLLRLLFPYPLFIEFRDKSWLAHKVLDKLISDDIQIVFPDVPEGLNLFELDNKQWQYDISYFRLHSRNKDNWWSNNEKDRYDYDYSKKELSEIKYLVNGSKTKDKFILFNNCPNGLAAKNGLAMQKIMGIDKSSFSTGLFKNE